MPIICDKVRFAAVGGDGSIIIDERVRLHDFWALVYRVSGFICNFALV